MKKLVPLVLAAALCFVVLTLTAATCGGGYDDSKLLAEIEQGNKDILNKGGNNDGQQVRVDRTQGILKPDIFGSVKGYEDYLDFSFEKPDWVVYDYGNAEYELLSAKILSGEEDYRDHMAWYGLNPQYIFRHNKAELDLVETVIQDGKLTQENKEKYGGLIRHNGSTQQPEWIIEAQCIPLKGTSYKVYLDDNGIVKGFEKSQILGVSNFNAPELSFEDETRQIDYFFQPIANNDGAITDYFLFHSNLLIAVDMENDETVDCSVLAVYESEAKAKEWRTGKGVETFNYLSYVCITTDFNGMFSKGIGGMFEQIYLISDINGTWDLIKTWEAYRALSLTQNQEPVPTAQPKFYFHMSDN